MVRHKNVSRKKLINEFEGDAAIRLALMQKAEKLGLAYKDVELPPDEVVVNKSFIHTMKSLVPYTQEWYEANIAEEDLDNLSHMKIEKAKAHDLVGKTKVGRHEEALEELMAETSNDFFYFNKLRTKLEQQGKFNMPNLDGEDPYTDSSQFNRLTKASKKAFAVVDEAVSKELAAYNRTIENIGRARPDAKCRWRGKTLLHGELCCLNFCMRHPTKTYTDDNGRSWPEILPNCAYHQRDCLNGLHESKLPVFIKYPNELGFCVECHIGAGRGKPQHLSREKAPGVNPISALLPTSIQYEDHGRPFFLLPRNPSSLSTCCWTPPTGVNKDSLQYGYRCRNPVILNADTNMYLRTCGMHVKACVRHHTPGTNNVIEVRNAYGLCNQHYLEQFGELPQPLAFPYEGLVSAPERKSMFVSLWQGMHFGTPRRAPRKNICISSQVPKYSGSLFSRRFHLRWKIYFYKKKTNQAVTNIQRIFRGFRCRYLHIFYKELKQLPRRQAAAVSIQAYVRMYFEWKFVMKLRELYMYSSIIIQKVTRGYLCRLYKMRHIAACKLQKLMKQVHKMKFRDGAVLVLHMRNLYRLRIKSCALIQRCYRGHVVRMKVFYARVMRFYFGRAAKRICLFVYRYIVRTRIVDVIEARKQFNNFYKRARVRLARLLTRAYRRYRERMQFQVAQRMLALATQPLVRGFIARRGVKKLRILRQAMRAMVTPTYAVDFMERLLKNQALDKPVHEVSLSYESPSSSIITSFVSDQSVSNGSSCSKSKKDDFIVRAFLDGSSLSSRIPQVHLRDSLAALEAYYIANGAVLLREEAENLLKLFKIQGTDLVHMGLLDDYVGLHQDPCLLHGRYVCGVCSARRECTHFGCACRSFDLNAWSPSVCMCCYHTVTMHRVVPLRLCNEQERSLKSVLQQAGSVVPDLSIPSGVFGISAREAMREFVAAKKNSGASASQYGSAGNFEGRGSSNENTTKQQLPSVHHPQALIPYSVKTGGSDIAYSLASCVLDASVAFKKNEYWKQHATSVVRPSMDDVLNLSVTRSVALPQYVFSKQEFWNAAAKHPNKSLRDYNEKFEHSMPMPIIENGELIYTIEGPRIYFNILFQLLKMEHTVDFDNPDLIRLIMDNIQIFERHWRKMVATIREGKLDHSLHVPLSSRATYESFAYPRPKLAAKLDNIFRKLGFHKKVLGMDIDIKSFAERVDNVKEEDIPLVPDRDPVAIRRRDSFSILIVQNDPPPGVHDSIAVASTSALSQRSRDSSRTADPRPQHLIPVTTTAGLRPGSCSLSEAESALSAASSSFSTSVTDDSAAIANLTKDVGHSYGNDSSGDEVGQPHPRPQRQGATLTAAHFMSAAAGSSLRRRQQSSEHMTFLERRLAKEAAMKMKREALISAGQAMYNGTHLAALKDREHELAVRAPSRRRPKAKRGGADDIETLRFATPAQVHESNYEQVTAPKASIDNLVYVPNMQRYICPFPACGKTFGAVEIAFQHLKDHEQRASLAIATPLTDSHLSAFWPKGAAWIEAAQFRQRAVPLGSHTCPISNCTFIFPSMKRLQIHLKNYHKIVPLPSNGLERDALATST